MRRGNQFGFRRAVRYAFTHGDCWALAHHLRERTGWDIVAVGIKGEEHLDVPTRHWAHMAVRTPNGQILDVTGLHSESDFLRRWPLRHYNTSLFVANHPGLLHAMPRRFSNLSVEVYGERMLSAIA